jgi:hypothetical protein
VGEPGQLCRGTPSDGRTFRTSQGQGIEQARIAQAWWELNARGLKSDLDPGGEGKEILFVIRVTIVGFAWWEFSGATAQY